MLGGVLVALADKAAADGRPDDAMVGADDREGQIAAKLRWDARRERLSRLV